MYGMGGGMLGTTVGLKQPLWKLLLNIDIQLQCCAGFPKLACNCVTIIANQKSVC